ncbi:transcriptional regulator NrdR [Patescibacteria group bacterium]
MRCPSCQSAETRVLDSRALEKAVLIRRRRECADCGFRFTTHEQLEVLDLTVVKKSGLPESYSRDKLLTGIRTACEKRPVTEDDLMRLLAEIDRELLRLADQNRSDSEAPLEISSQVIGEVVLKYLQSFDAVAFVRFASVYRAYDDVDSFVEEVKSISNNKNNVSAEKEQTEMSAKPENI